MSGMGAMFKVSWRGKERVGIALSEIDDQGEALFCLLNEGVDPDKATAIDFISDKTYSLPLEAIGDQISENAGNILLEQLLRQQVLANAHRHYQIKHAAKKSFTPGQPISYGGRYFDEKELLNLVDSSLDFWLTTGRYTDRFEKALAKFLGVRYSLVTNSGSSANLLAFMSLTSPMLKDRRIRKGDEVITLAASFPTTVNPIVQFGAVPVFVDIELETYNMDVTKLEAALSNKTKAIMVAHTLGNPFHLQHIRDFCDKHNLWLIEDNCDALGSRFFYNNEWKFTGTIGHIGTSSFYPPHHITMGEGGAVYTNDPILKRDRIFPGLGAGLLVRLWPRQYVQASVLAAIRGTSGRLRSQVRLYAFRI